MKIQSVKMVHPSQIVKKGYKGCKSTRTVTNFCQKNHVPHVWWKPSGAQNKVMLIEMSCFASAWKDYQSTQKTKSASSRRSSSSRTKIARKKNRTTAKSRTSSMGRRMTASSKTRSKAKKGNMAKKRTARAKSMSTRSTRMARSSRSTRMRRAA